jgi:hypothetical protein
MWQFGKLLTLKNKLWRFDMSAYMRTKTIGEFAEISLSITLPISELELMTDTLKSVLAQAGHVVRSVNEEDNEIYSADEVLSNSRSGMTLRGFRIYREPDPGRTG